MRPAPARGVEIRKRLFTTLMSELARRGNGMRESGAFLLGTAASETGSPEDTRPVIEAIAFYHDLDPGCLTGTSASPPTGTPPSPPGAVASACESLPTSTLIPVPGSARAR